MSQKMLVAVIGGGAAGFFAAISAAENYPGASVVIFEKSAEVLSKVRISGGGRCNVTHHCGSLAELVRAYPRGGQSLKKIFGLFGPEDTMAWFRARGVPLVIQEDQCVFPESQDSQSIIDCFLGEADRLKITIETGFSLESVQYVEGRFRLKFQKNYPGHQIFDRVIVAAGGGEKSSLQWIRELGHEVVPCIPSLFTFNMPEEPIRKLMGIVVENTKISIQGTRFVSRGTLLVTHWGMSGPAILLLSSYAARFLHEHRYEFSLRINWVDGLDEAGLRDLLERLAAGHSHKLVANIHPPGLPVRLWNYLLDKSGVSEDRTWSDLGKKDMNRLVNVLTNDPYSVQGRAAFKEEFVTCGGVSLKCVDLRTMQSRVCKGLYFAGEILDIDGITGGFNLQSAWTTGYVAGKLS